MVPRGAPTLTYTTSGGDYAGHLASFGLLGEGEGPGAMLDAA